MRRPALALLAVACAVTPPDRDGDGYPDHEDCRPDDPAIHPGAVEVCDGVDNDCDGTIDEEAAVVWYFDGDEDGFGDEQNRLLTCDPPTGVVEVAGDCDDAAPQTHPGALERCDGRDNDCNGAVDDLWPLLDPDGDPAPEGVRLTGAADVIDVDGVPVVRLVPSTGPATGGWWLERPLPGGDLRLRFRFRMVAPTGSPGEGLVVAMVSGQTGPVQGADGRDLGLYGAHADGLAVEIDPVPSDFLDGGGAQAHVALHDIRTGKELSHRALPVDVLDGEWHDLDLQITSLTIALAIDRQALYDASFLPMPPGEAITLGLIAATSADRAMQVVVDDVSVSCPSPF